MKKKLQFILINAITSIRMLGVVLLLPIYFSYGGVALGLTNIACFLTDFADGKLARKFHLSTFFGSLYDGLADKSFLIINMIILLTISPYAIIPILLELGIAGLQTYKYKKNYNVKSNIIGKAKMWVAGICVVLSNFLVDIDKLTFLGHSMIDKLSKISDSNLVLASLAPYIIADIATFISYFKEIKVAKNQKESKIEEILKEREEIQKEKEKIQKQKEELISMKEFLFSPEYYDEHKDDRNLQEQVLKRVLKRKKEDE